ncbi:SpoIIE family protein phosphatase [Streptomyces sp. V4I2]|uniref:SpoIIE family protein phosphatase n=1 Tax=Streptomyces sp. V4I2 TaxID=3042280 RepID=UPI00278AE01B|nr:SpoIIE family protein phosphatase [Streptomyces sp. V4I2]MDQ1046764.1 hypothetical protein [Streptomyces sp. V4I2]
MAAVRGFPARATLLLHTDGLSEARNARGEFYDPEARLAGCTFRVYDDPQGPLLREVIG